MKGWGEWLRTLSGNLWKGRTEPHTGMNFGVEMRRLSPDEWQRLQDIITEKRLPCVMGNACWGFGCGMLVFLPSRQVSIEFRVDPEPVLWVTKDHLPLPEDTDRTLFEDGWKAFSPFTHSPSNRARLVEEGLPEPKSKEYYQY